MEADNYRYNEDMLDDPVLPSMRGESMDLKDCLRQRALYLMLGSVTLQLGYEPNASGTYSYRKYAISMVCRALGYHKATRVAQHNRASAPAVNAVYDNDNANEDIGAAEMGRRQESMEAVESLAATRVPALGQFLTSGQVPRGSRAYKEELLESWEWVAAIANVGAAEEACKLAHESGPKQLLKTAEAALKAAKEARAKLRPKLMHRVLVRHRMYVWKEGFERLQLQASREELQQLTAVVEYPSMSEAQAVVFHLEAHAAAERAAAAKAAAAKAAKTTGSAARKTSKALTIAGELHATGGDGGRAARRSVWRVSRAEQQGFQLEADEAEVVLPLALASDAAAAPAEVQAELPAVASDAGALPAVPPLVLMVGPDVAPAPAELPVVMTVVSETSVTAPQLQVSSVAASAVVRAAVLASQQADEALLCEYEQAMRDQAVGNAKRALSATYKGSERQMMRVLKRARLARK